VHTKIKSGAAGENSAAEYLVANGYRVRERNFRFKRGEIDLIAEKENWLVFVEVKTRSSPAFGFPEQFVDEKKRLMVLATAAHYLDLVKWAGQVRYDVIAITLQPEVELVHFQDAFY
jgi:putative endonuclease